MRLILFLALLGLGGCAGVTPDPERTTRVPGPQIGSREPQVRSSGGLDIILGGQVSVGASAR